MVNVRNLKLILLWLLPGLLLFGCQGMGSDQAGAAESVTLTLVPTSTPLLFPTSTAIPAPTLTPFPTATPTPTPTPTPFVCASSQGETLNGSFISEAMGGEEIRYLVHLPPCYEHYQDRAYPVLYLLHGWPMNESHWEELGIVAIADVWVSQGLAGPFIIVLPGVTNTDGRYVHSSGGNDSFEGMLVAELSPLIARTYRTWNTPAGRAIGGISRGGVWSLEIGLRHPELFGIVGGHSPALSMNHPPRQYDPFFLAQSGVTDQRIYLSAGDMDWARGGTVRLYDQLLEQGADITYETHTGGHVDDLWRLGLPDYLRFYIRTWPRSAEALPRWMEVSHRPQAEERR